jgi:hypothetical protein
MTEKGNSMLRHGNHTSSEDEKIDLEKIEDIAQPQGQAARISRFTKEEEEAVIRKLDWHLMPLIFVLYSLSVLDRSNLGNAKIAGMTKDIDLAGNRYSWLGTIFYVSCKYSNIIWGSKANKSRYLFSMDSNGVEGLSPTSMGCMCSLFLGSSLKRTSSSNNVGGTDGLPISPRNTRSYVWASSASLPLILLSA